VIINTFIFTHFHYTFQMEEEEEEEILEQDDKIVIHEDFNAWLLYGGLDDDAVLRLCKVPDISKIDDYMRSLDVEMCEEWGVQERKVIIHSKVLYQRGYDGPEMPIEKFGYLIATIGDADHHFKIADYDAMDSADDFASALQAVGLYFDPDWCVYFANPIEYDDLL
jgi:hypothetical protein